MKMCHDEAKDDATWLAKEVQEGQTFRKHTTDHMLPTLFSLAHGRPACNWAKWVICSDSDSVRLLENRVLQ